MTFVALGRDRERHRRRKRPRTDLETVEAADRAHITVLRRLKASGPVFAVWTGDLHE